MNRCLVLVLCAPALLPSRAEAQVASFCNQSVFYDASTNGATQLVPAVAAGTGRIYVCGYVLNVTTTTTTVGLVQGTGSNCGTNQVKLTPAWTVTATTPVSDNAGPIIAPSATALCINTGAGNAVQGRVSYTIIP